MKNAAPRPGHGYRVEAVVQEESQLGTAVAFAEGMNRIQLGKEKRCLLDSEGLRAQGRVSIIL